VNYQFITSDGDLESVCQDLGREKIIGVDLEADSMHSFTEKICLIQIWGGGRAYLVDPFEISDFSPFSRVLENPDIIKIFHGSDFDVRSLDRELAVQIKNLFDTEIACRFLNIKERGLGALLKSYFNVYVDKRFQKAAFKRGYDCLFRGRCGQTHRTPRPAYDPIGKDRASGLGPGRI